MATVTLLTHCYNKNYDSLDEKKKKKIFDNMSDTYSTQSMSIKLLILDFFYNWMLLRAVLYNFCETE